MRPLNITVTLEEGLEFDTVKIEHNGVETTSPVQRDAYVESRWGRYHNAKSRVRHMVSDILLNWSFS